MSFGSGKGLEGNLDMQNKINESHLQIIICTRIFKDLERLENLWPGDSTFKLNVFRGAWNNMCMAHQGPPMAEQ